MQTKTSIFQEFRATPVISQGAIERVWYREKENIFRGLAASLGRAARGRPEVDPRGCPQAPCDPGRAPSRSLSPEAVQVGTESDGGRHLAPVSPGRMRSR